MPKKHGPEFNREQIQVERCRPCRGSGTVQGGFYQLPCDDCAGVGWVARGIEGVSMHDLAWALGQRANKAENDLSERIRCSIIAGNSDSEWNNKKGPGGSHYRGD
ncbi:hypothetical protein [Pseudomonas nitroreducens]|uniref:hypothetical protein n=1 Tax=Pseudomonas nitroreducens TaxID=46680 RepID=UPI003CC82F9F